jgi:hypothetical protein
MGPTRNRRTTAGLTSRQLVVGDWSATANQLLTAGCLLVSDQWSDDLGRAATSSRPSAAGLFLNFFDFFEFFFWNDEVLLGIWGEWVHSAPIYSSFPLHLEVSNLPFHIKFRDFTFFKILFLPNLEYTWTFTSTVWIFVSWKIEITKISRSFC